MAIKGRKPGRKAKDLAITENFNTEKQLTPREERELKQQKKMIAEAKKKAKEKFALVNRLTDGKEAKAARDMEDFSESDFQMLQDMRAVYKKLGGQKKLLSFIKQNDKAYELMVKELMKLESSMKQAEIRRNDAPGGAGNGNVFVILKGLEDEQKTVTMVMAADGQGQIDMHSLAGVFKPGVEPGTDDLPPDDENVIDPTKG